MNTKFCISIVWYIFGSKIHITQIQNVMIENGQLYFLKFKMVTQLFIKLYGIVIYTVAAI